MKGIAVLVGFAVLPLIGSGAAAQAGATVANLAPVGGSGVSGVVSLHQTGDQTGISVFATGLQPGTDYVSLYYDNGSCQLEPYSADDVIGGPYTADSAGLGRTQGDADDPLDDIHSVSVRRASDFALLACAPVMPIGS